MKTIKSYISPKIFYQDIFLPGYSLPKIRCHISFLLLFKILEGSRVAKIDRKFQIWKFHFVWGYLKHQLQSLGLRPFSLFLFIPLGAWKHGPRSNGSFTNSFGKGNKALLYSTAWPRTPNLSVSVSQVMGMCYQTDLVLELNKQINKTKTMKIQLSGQRSKKNILYI